MKGRSVAILNNNMVTETDNLKHHRHTPGNYFIMDSEQVVSNPYQDLQSEALDSAKKTSLTERLTAVRNNVCEHNLRTKTTHLEKQRTHRLRNIHMDTSNLRYQVKVMDIDKRKNDLALQKRITPQKDFSFDSRQIQTSAKRLGMTSEESFYLDKKLQYPLRGNILRDHNAKPFIKKAKKVMADHTFRKKQESERSFHSRTDRATTAHTVSTTVDIPSSPEPCNKAQETTLHRNGSKSAPPPRISTSDPHFSSSRLSVIDETDAKLPTIPASGSTAVPGAGGNVSRNAKSHVKFKVASPPFRQSTPDKLLRSRTYHSGVGRVTRSYSEGWDSDDSDDDYMFTEKVDLRALFFSDKSQSGETKSTISGTTTPRTMPTRMSGEIPSQFKGPSSGPPKITEDMLNKEQQEIKDRIDRFLGNMKKDEERKAKLLREQKLKEESEKETEAQKLEKETLSRAATLLKIFSKPLDPTKIWGYTPPKREQKSATKEKTAEELEAEKPKTAEADNSNRTKKLWELIKTNVQNGNVTSKKKYTANDLLLQQLTGILVHSDSKCNIPTNTASRALRHTPTFKMRRVIEELMRQRTRYEQQEIEKLQQENEEANKMNSIPSRAWATPTAELEQES